MRAQRAVGAWLCVPGPCLCSHTAQRLYCAYYQASVCNHILLESTAKFSTGQVQVSKPCPPAATRVEPGSVACKLVLCLLEHSNIYTFVISYLKPVRRLDIQKINMFFND